MANVICVIVVAAAVGLAALFIIKEKKKGKHCIGCPYAQDCAKARSGKGCGGM